MKNIIQRVKNNLEIIVVYITTVGVIAGACYSMLSSKLVVKTELLPLYSKDSLLFDRQNKYETGQYLMMQKLNDVSTDLKDIKSYLIRRK